MDIENHLNLYEALIEEVELSYFLYKVCEGCDSLVMYETAVCPKCNAYRFNTRRKEVVKVLKEELGSLVHSLTGFSE